MASYLDTYYTRSLAEKSLRPSLAGDLKADVAIVGGGLAGLTAGLELARAGRSVIIVESKLVGWGASGRNGGFVGPGYATSLANIARMVGEQKAHVLYRMSIEGVRIVEENLKNLPDSDNPKVNGKISVLRYHDPDRLMRRSVTCRSV